MLCPVLMSAFLGWIYFVSPNGVHMAAFDCMTAGGVAHGLRFVLADAVAEGVTFAALAWYARARLGVDVLRVGTFLLRRHAAYFALLPMAALIFVATIWNKHAGYDESLEFAWLRGGDMSGGVSVCPGEEAFTAAAAALFVNATL